jgi:nitronate monooxygenase
MGGAQAVLEGVLEKTRGMVTASPAARACPTSSEIAARFNVCYLPIVSSGRAFRALWKRSLSQGARPDGAVVYEDPWLAGGHNGLSNAEDPTKPEDPYPRVKALRDTMRAEGVPEACRSSWPAACGPARMERLDRQSRAGQIAFQFGTRPLLTQESPIPQIWKDMLRTGAGRRAAPQVLAHRLLFSSAVRNPFLRSLEARSERQIPYPPGRGGRAHRAAGRRREGQELLGDARVIWTRPRMWHRRKAYRALKTPDDTVVFVAPAERAT